MEHLNKTQLILLVLLISFVTSIATGIMTVSLLQQAPVEVTRTINSVVEKTIQSVAPSIINPTPKDTTTVVVTEESQVLSSIQKNVKSVVRINKTDALGAEVFYGLGVVVTSDGVIATDRQSIDATSIYTATFSDNAVWKLVPLGVDKNTNSIFFKTNLPATTTYPFSPASLASSDVQLGQSVIGLGGLTQNAVAVGRVSSFVMKDSGQGTSTVKYISGVENDVSGINLLDGSPFFDLSGDLVGMKFSVSDSSSFVPISIIQKELSETLNK